MHPRVGLLRLDYTNLWLDQRLGTRIVTFTPADEQTSERLRTLYRSLEASSRESRLVGSSRAAR